jgi:hypothetical protein
MICTQPNKLQLIMYTGGQGGEFLSYLFNQHQECATVDIKQLPNNKYAAVNLKEHAQWQIDSDSSDQLLFVPVHPKLSPSLNEILRTGQANLFIADVSTKYHFYYQTLFLLKTTYFKLDVNTPSGIKTPMLENNTWNNFKQAINRNFYYWYEAEAFSVDGCVPNFLNHLSTILDLWEEINIDALESRRRCVCAEYLMLNSTKLFNVDELYFGNTKQAYTELCSWANITPNYELIDVIHTYRLANIRLIEKYADISFDNFLNLDLDSIKKVTYQTIVKYHNEPLITLP